MREDHSLVHRFKLSPGPIRTQIDSATVIREKVSTSVDLPLSNECKRVLAYAAEEAERLGHKHIGSEHFLLALLREEGSFAAELLRGAGLRLEQARVEIASAPAAQSIIDTCPSVGAGHPAPTIEFVEDGKLLTISALILVLPRAGEEVVLHFNYGPRTYRVEDVRFVLGSDPQFKSQEGQRLEKIQVLLKRASA
jgi:ATP-dependent Clp protease ATP-binding subunit ClpC